MQIQPREEIHVTYLYPRYQAIEKPITLNVKFYVGIDAEAARRLVNIQLMLKFGQLVITYGDLGILTRSIGGFALGGRIINEYEAALAMKICDEAGIDITRKAIWKDRNYTVFSFVPIGNRAAVAEVVRLRADWTEF